jgi:predicted metalloprotease with PDZ domain
MLAAFLITSRLSGRRGASHESHRDHHARRSPNTGVWFHFELPAQWHQTATSLAGAPDGTPNDYAATSNVKRFRPVELGPFDYEHPPRTAGLRLAEGVTSYYGELLVSRSGVGSIQDILNALSTAITTVQNRPARLVQTLEQASLGIFATGGVRRGRQRHGAVHGYTPDDLVVLASELAGTDLTEFRRKALRSTGKLDYTEALDWFGLRFAASTDSTKAWNLEVRADATPAQQARLKTLAGKYAGM